VSVASIKLRKIIKQRETFLFKFLSLMVIGESSGGQKTESDRSKEGFMNRFPATENG